MSILRLSRRHTADRHTWCETDLYGKLLAASLCGHCGAPETRTDAKKLEISKLLLAEFGPPETAPCYKVWNRASELLRQYLESTRQVKLLVS